MLNALTINPVVVATILSYMDKKFEKERNDSGKLSFETSLFCRQLSKLRSDEYKKEGLTLFDLALLLRSLRRELNSTKRWAGVS